MNVRKCVPKASLRVRCGDMCRRHPFGSDVAAHDVCRRHPYGKDGEMWELKKIEVDCAKDIPMGKKIEKGVWLVRE